jgi:hypothetical protein
VTYAAISGATNIFTVTSEGRLMSLKPMEKKNVEYSLTVKATDGGGLSTQINIRVNSFGFYFLA